MNALLNTLIYTTAMTSSLHYPTIHHICITGPNVQLACQITQILCNISTDVLPADSIVVWAPEAYPKLIKNATYINTTPHMRISHPNARVAIVYHPSKKTPTLLDMNNIHIKCPMVKPGIESYASLTYHQTDNIEQSVRFSDPAVCIDLVQTALNTHIEAMDATDKEHNIHLQYKTEFGEITNLKDMIDYHEKTGCTQGKIFNVSPNIYHHISLNKFAKYPVGDWLLSYAEILGEVYTDEHYDIFVNMMQHPYSGKYEREIITGLLNGIRDVPIDSLYNEGIFADEARITMSILKMMKIYCRTTQDHSDLVDAMCAIQIDLLFLRHMENADDDSSDSEAEDAHTPEKFPQQLALFILNYPTMHTPQTKLIATTFLKQYPPPTNTKPKYNKFYDECCDLINQMKACAI